MDTGDLLIRWTVRLAMGCYLAVLVAAILNRTAPATTRGSRWIWTIGGVLFWGHVIAAFHFYHHWNHAHAFADTAEKTAAALGWRFGWGIYVNHLFALVWAADAAASWLRAEAYRRRPVWLTAAVHGFLIFIAVNGLVVFKDGLIRWTSVAVCLGVVVLWAFASRARIITVFRTDPALPPGTAARLPQCDAPRPDQPATSKQNPCS